jgi:3',5'-cyclic-AMP phosphodiesterase
MNLRVPIYYVVGNHDDSAELQRTLAGIDEPQDRYDYAFESGGVQFVVLESNGPVAPGGDIQSRQLEWLSQYVAPDGPPLVIALHHPPMSLDVPWLDEVITMSSSMLIANSEQFLHVIRPARERLRGVFFGHVHRSFQVWQDGMLFSSAPSASAQLKTWPGLRKPAPAPEEAPEYCLVTVDGNRTIVQQYSFAHAS